jgi:hypothetical protein
LDVVAGVVRSGTYSTSGDTDSAAASPRLRLRNYMIKPKRSAEQQIADEAKRIALNPLTLRQTISDSQAEPEFQENHKRLKADRLAREAALKVKRK